MKTLPLKDGIFTDPNHKEAQNHHESLFLLGQIYITEWYRVQQA